MNTKDVPFIFLVPAPMQAIFPPSLDITRLLHSDQAIEAIAYILASVSACLLATWLGYMTGRAVW